MAKSVLGSAVAKITQKTTKKGTTTVAKVKNEKAKEKASSETKNVTTNKSTTKSTTKATIKSNPTVKINSSVETFDVFSTLKQTAPISSVIPNTNSSNTATSSITQPSNNYIGEITNNSSWGS